jgi:hypothetical protein
MKTLSHYHFPNDRWEESQGALSAFMYLQTLWTLESSTVLVTFFPALFLMLAAKCLLRDLELEYCCTIFQPPTVIHP